MTAARLQIVLAAELLIFFLAVLGAVRSVGVALAIALALVFALDCVLILITFAVSWPRSSEAVPARKPALIELAAMIAAECLSYFVLFAVIQPFETLFMPRHQAPVKRTPVLMVHGYVCNRGLWWWLARRLRAVAIFVEPVNLEPPYDSIERLADKLRDHIEAHLAGSESKKAVLVTHSMGGLVARAYLKRYGKEERVSKLITLACPHHGTRLAYRGFGQNAREMEPDSPWLRELSSQVLSVPVLNIWSVHDNFVAPQKYARLKGVREIVFPRLGHLTFAFSKRVLEVLLRELA